jgi:hypothetical protein
LTRSNSKTSDAGEFPALFEHLSERRAREDRPARESAELRTVPHRDRSNRKTALATPPAEAQAATQTVGAPIATTPAAASPDTATVSDTATASGGDVSLPAPNQPVQPAVAPEPAPDASLASHSIAVPAGADVHVLPVHPPGTLAGGKLKTAMNPVDRVLAAASAIWPPRSLVRVEADAVPEQSAPADSLPEPVAPPSESGAASGVLAGDHTALREVAFEAHLKPVTSDQVDASPRGDAPSIAKPVAAADPPSPHTQKPNKLEDDPLPRPEARPAMTAKPVPQAEVAAARETAPEKTRIESAQPARPAELKEAADTTRAGPEAHDIRLEVAGGDRRVEVRLTERGGEVRVAVRTADSHLAGTLRENLPALSSKLVESGFRTETWHPASAAAERRTAETAAGGPARDANQQSQEHGGGRQSDADSRHPKAPHEQIPRKDKGKDFAWLMSSLQ